MLLHKSSCVLKYNSFGMVKQERQMKFQLKIFLFPVISRDLGRSSPVSLDIITAISFLVLSPVLHVSYGIHLKFLETCPF